VNSNGEEIWKDTDPHCNNVNPIKDMKEMMPDLDGMNDAHSQILIPGL
jgi:hypothetical protein